MVGEADNKLTPMYVNMYLYIHIRMYPYLWHTPVILRMKSGGKGWVVRLNYAVNSRPARPHEK